MIEWLNNAPAAVWLLLAAMCGGLTCFLSAVKRGAIRNNKVARKAAIEIAGGTLTGFFLSLPTKEWSTEYRALVAFGGGLTWSVVIQVIRNRITKIVEAVLGNPDNPST